VRGGKREGAGRPKAAPTAVIRIRLPLAQHAVVVELGSDIWIKELIQMELLKLGYFGVDNGK
jgi:hypothetical protein